METMIFMIIAGIISFIISFVVAYKLSNRFGLNPRIIYLISVICCIIMTSTYFMVTLFIPKYYYENRKFNLDNSNKYIIYNTINNEDLYEVDFNKNEIIYMIHETYRGKISKKYIQEIKEIVENTIIDDNNLESQHEDRILFFKRSVYKVFN